MLRFSISTTRAVLFALDAALIGAVWPHVRRASRPDSQSRFTLPIDVRGLAYRIFDLLLLFAMGMYRREAILQSGHSLVRVPLVVGMGAALAILGSLLQPLLISTVAMKGGRDQAMLFALAVVSFTFCALFARLVMYVLKRHHVLRRRLLIVGAGQRANGPGICCSCWGGGQQPAR